MKVLDLKQIKKFLKDSSNFADFKLNIFNYFDEDIEEEPEMKERDGDWI